MDGRFDEILMTVAAQAGGVEGLLKTFFGFLNRRTDFYALIPDDVADPKMGFRPGAAEALLVACFRSFPYKDFAGNAVPDPRPFVPKVKVVPPPAPVDTASSEEKKSKGTEETAESEDAKATEESEGVGKTQDPPSSQPLRPRVVKEDLPSLQMNDAGKQIPLGNGGVGKNYHWHQTLRDLTVFIKFPEGTKTSDVTCGIKSNRITCGLKGQEPILAGIYPEEFRVKPSESFWSFEADIAVLTVSLDKTQETWWDSVIIGEPEIDTQQVDSTRPIEDYDEQTQGTIRKIMFDQDQKRKGLPTSEEMKKYEILERCKDLPGSPFLPENMNISQNVPRPHPDDEIE